MAALAVIFIVLGCGAYQYLKGSIFKAVIAIMVTVFSSAAAFGFFEMLGDFLIGKTSNASFLPWVQPLSFLVILVLSFAVLQTAAMQLCKTEVDFGVLAERIGRPILGVFMGLLVSGLLMTALALAPLPNKYPYQRFDPRNPNPQNPTGVLLNVDGFATGWFSILSKGSLRAIRDARSFAVIHPDYIDQLYLNRHNDSDKIPLNTEAGAVQVPSKEGAWEAPAGGMKDSNGESVSPQTGHSLVVVRAEMYSKYLETSGNFTLGQFRLICKREGSEQEQWTGRGINAYPIGYFSGADKITTKNLSEKITLKWSDFPENQYTRQIDFVFNVPNDYAPVALEFKQNCISAVPKVVSSNEAPAVSPFVEKGQAEPSTTTPGEAGEGGTPQAPSNQGSSSSQDPTVSPATRHLLPQLDLNE